MQQCNRYLLDDGMQIEPRCYVPIVPTLLLNGAEGIATGWSTSIPMYNPQRVIDAVIACISAPESASWEQLPALDPWFCGFTGPILPLPSGDGFETHGVFKTVKVPVDKRSDVSLAVHVTELPIGRWIDDFQATLHKLCEEDKDGNPPLVDTFSHNNTEAVVDTTIYFTKAAAAVTQDSEGGVNEAGTPSNHPPWMRDREKGWCMPAGVRLACYVTFAKCGRLAGVAGCMFEPDGEARWQGSESCCASPRESRPKICTRSHPRVPSPSTRTRGR